MYGSSLAAMYDTYIVKRTQIYLDEDQAARLARRAQAQGSTVSSVIREAIEAYLSDPDDSQNELARQRQALQDGFAAVPRLPEGSAYVDELRKADTERERDQEDLWRSR
jgi:predicted DNA-binding protein